MTRIQYMLLKLFGDLTHNLDYLYHYYRKGTLPFQTITDMNFSTIEEYVCYSQKKGLIKEEYFDYTYFERRLYYETIMRQQFIQIGGVPIRKHPMYCTLGYGKMFNQHRNKEFVRIPIHKLNLKTVSFTYGDSFPTYNVENCNCMREYYGRVYDYDGILKIIQKYGLPGKNGKTMYGYETYVEAQLWSDDVLLHIEYLPSGVKM